jgi:phosphatidylglycerophosphate synthase
LNVLNLHQGGIERVVIYHPDLASPPGKPLTLLKEDARVQGAVEWVAEFETLDRIVKDNACRLVVNGAALHDQADIAAARDGSLAPERARAMGCYETSPGTVRQVLDHFEKASDSAAAPVLTSGSAEGGDHRLTVVTGSPATQVRQAEDFKVQRERLLTRGGMASDSFMDRWVSRHFSRQFTRLLIDTPVTPNQITWMHLAVGVGSAWFFYQGTYAMVVAGAVLLMISAWLDATDGEVARLRFQQSRFGMILDIIGDNVVHWAVFLGIGWGVARATGNDIYILCGLLSVVGAVISFWLLQASVFKKRGGGEYESSGWEDELANRDFLYFLFVMALIDQLNIFIAISAVGSNLFAGYVFYKKMKTA